MAKLLIIIVLALAVYFGWPWIQQVPWGHLPGDVEVYLDNFRFYFPITTGSITIVGILLLWWFLTR